MPYTLPASIKINIHTYERWLERKARSIVRRLSKKEGIRVSGLKAVKDAIHDAVEKSDGKDFYTGEVLDWSLVSRWNNVDAKKGGSQYLKKFALLPTVDHYDGRKSLNFVICSWRVNDAKNHLTHDEFVDLCRKVVEYSDK